jgi:beta-N-acetylhexosaminidase
MPSNIKQLVGQLIIAGFRDSELSKNSAIEKYIKAYNLAGVILYDEDVKIGGPGTRNVKSPTQLKTLIEDLQSLSPNQNLLISIDQEGGTVHRLKSIYGFPETPSWQHIGLLKDKLITKQFSETLSETLCSVGINVNFAPVLDLDYGNKTVISKTQRAFTSDSDLLIKHAKIFIDAHRKRHIISCGKHFPGQGSAFGDTHEGYTDISNSWTVKDLLPFDKLIQANYLDLIMVSHTFDNKLDPIYPASLSKKIVTHTLRDDLEFQGVVICDDPSMRAISDNYNLRDTFEIMLNAGIDLFCLGNNLIYDPDYIPRSVNAICELLTSGKIKEERILTSIERIKTLKKKYKIRV